MYFFFLLFSSSSSLLFLVIFHFFLEDHCTLPYYFPEGAASADGGAVARVPVAAGRGARARATGGAGRLWRPRPEDRPRRGQAEGLPGGGRGRPSRRGPPGRPGVRAVPGGRARGRPALPRGLRRWAAAGARLRGGL